MAPKASVLTTLPAASFAVRCSLVSTIATGLNRQAPLPHHPKPPSNPTSLRPRHDWRRRDAAPIQARLLSQHACMSMPLRTRSNTGGRIGLPPVMHAHRPGEAGAAVPVHKETQHAVLRLARHDRRSCSISPSLPCRHVNMCAVYEQRHA